MNQDKRKMLWIFVAVAYLITWIPWIPLERYAAQRHYVLPNPQTLPALLEDGVQDATHLTLVLLSFAMILFSGPLLAAVIAYALESGRKGIRGLWQTSTRWRIGWRWYGIMLAILLAINLPTFMFGLVRGPLPAAAQVRTILIWLVPVFLYTFFASGLEEPGWRGYALPKLQSRYSAKKASVILGVIWGIWHWPVFIPVYTRALNSPGGVPQAVTTLLIQLALYILSSMLSGALIYTWLYNRTGSVFLCILFHTLHNNAITYVAMLFPAIAQSVPLIGTITQWLVAIILTRFFWTEVENSGVGWRQGATVPEQAAQP
jgi:membrane protease YdiL (CAAX protease family)